VKSNDNDMSKTISEAEDLMANLDELMHSRMNDAEQKLKKGIVQGVIWVLVTVAIYFIWGTTWFFWVSLGLNIITIGGIVFAKVMIAKAKKKMSESGDTTDYDFDADVVEDEVEYDEKQKVLEKLLNELEEIGEEHGEIYDTDCREQMSEAVFNGFIFEKEGYVLPDTFGLYEKDGNSAVKEVLSRYIEKMLPLAKESSAKERLEMFQDEVYSESGESADEFFGWVDVDNFENLR